VRSREEIVGGIVFSIVKWGFFVVALAILPVLIGALSTVTRGDQLRFATLLEHGELLLVSVAIIGAAAAELFAKDSGGFQTLKLSVGGMAGLVVLAASMWFADIAAGLRDGSVLDPQSIAVGSVVVFALAIVTGISCIVVAELARNG
jgi:hypothetical protein